MIHRPIVSVVTPVYNGARYLAECMESVLGQSFGAFEYVVLDNGSTDETHAIASRYAGLDRRIRFVRNESTVPMIENWNRALDLMSADSTYCKTMHADDTIYPDCLERMVALAERHRSVGIVGSLRQRGTQVQCGGLPRGPEVFSGREVARLFLRGEVFGFAPTSGMIRSDLVRARRPFYPPAYLHADLAAYFDLLDRTDFGFIDDVLCFSRMHEESVTTTVAERRQTLLREWLFLLHEFGPRYFEPGELAAIERDHLRRYHRVLLRTLVTRPSHSFLAYHLSGLRAAGRMPRPRDLAVALLAELRACVAHPERLRSHLRSSPPRR